MKKLLFLLLFITTLAVAKQPPADLPYTPPEGWEYIKNLDSSTIYNYFAYNDTLGINIYYYRKGNLEFLFSSDKGENFDSIMFYNDKYGFNSPSIFISNYNNSFHFNNSTSFCFFINDTIEKKIYFEKTFDGGKNFESYLVDTTLYKDIRFQFNSFYKNPFDNNDMIITAVDYYRGFSDQWIRTQDGGKTWKLARTAFDPGWKSYQNFLWDYSQPGYFYVEVVRLDNNGDPISLRRVFTDDNGRAWGNNTEKDRLINSGLGEPLFRGLDKVYFYRYYKDLSKDKSGRISGNMDYNTHEPDTITSRFENLIQKALPDADQKYQDTSYHFGIGISKIGFQNEPKANYFKICDDDRNKMMYWIYIYKNEIDSSNKIIQKDKYGALYLSEKGNIYKLLEINNDIPSPIVTAFDGITFLDIKKNILYFSTIDGRLIGNQFAGDKESLWRKDINKIMTGIDDKIDTVQNITNLKEYLAECKFYTIFDTIGRSAGSQNISDLLPGRYIIISIDKNEKAHSNKILLTK